MATITKTYTENGGTYHATWTVNYTCADVTASASTFSFSPTITAKYAYSGSLTKNSGYAVIRIRNKTETSQEFKFSKPSTDYEYTPMTNGTTYTITRRTTYTSNTSTFFNSNNPTAKTVTLEWETKSINLASQNSGAGNKVNGKFDYSRPLDIGSLCKVTLNAPPTATVTGALTGQPYVDACTYTATISSLSAKYGGTISSVKLTIGSQSATRTTNGKLVIHPNTAGTFTPTVTITDSRGQKTTKTLSKITVKANTVAISSLSAGRTDANGIADDENVYARLTLKTTYTPFTGNYLQEPSVTIGGNYDTVTWYHNWSSSAGFSNPVDWTNYAPASPVTIYGKASGTYADTQSYPVSVTVSTTYRSATKSITLSQSFYLLSGRPGGKGLGIGMKPTGNNLYISMNTISKGTLTIENHDSPIGTIISNVGNDIAIASGGSLKNTGISISVPSGAWLIVVYAHFGTTNSGIYRGVSYRYRDNGGTWSAATVEYNAVPITGSTAVPTTTTLVNFDNHTTTREYEITVRSNPAITFSGIIKAIRIA